MRATMSRSHSPGISHPAPTRESAQLDSSRPAAARRLPGQVTGHGPLLVAATAGHRTASPGRTGWGLRRHALAHRALRRPGPSPMPGYGTATSGRRSRTRQFTRRTTGDRGPRRHAPFTGNWCFVAAAEREKPRKRTRRTSSSRTTGIGDTASADHAARGGDDPGCGGPRPEGRRPPRCPSSTPALNRTVSVRHAATSRCPGCGERRAGMDHRLRAARTDSLPRLVVRLLVGDPAGEADVEVFAWAKSSA